MRKKKKIQLVYKQGLPDPTPPKHRNKRARPKHTVAFLEMKKKRKMRQYNLEKVQKRNCCMEINVLPPHPFTLAFIKEIHVHHLSPSVVVAQVLDRTQTAQLWCQQYNSESFSFLHTFIFASKQTAQRVAHIWMCVSYSPWWNLVLSPISCYWAVRVSDMNTGMYYVWVRSVSVPSLWWGFGHISSASCGILC